MSGVILKHDKFGNHLNKDGRFGSVRIGSLNEYGDVVRIKECVVTRSGS